MTLIEKNVLIEYNGLVINKPSVIFDKEQMYIININQSKVT